MADRPVLIIGANGKTGARVHRRLAARGVAVRAASRASQVRFDWTQRETWGPALAGAGKAYVTFQPDLAVDGSAEAIGHLADLARAEGLEQVVLLSGRGEPGAERAEAALAASGVPWTIVRASWFDQNFSEGYLAESVRAGELALPAGAVREPFVDAEDIADVVAAALTDPRHIGQCYETTGPRALTFAEAVDEIAAATGRPLRYTQVTPHEFGAGLATAGVPADIAALLDELFTVVLDGRNEAIAHGVEAALGRPPRDFADYARAAAAAGAFGP